MIGLKRKTVKLVEHNPLWEKDFLRQKEILQEILGDKALGIHHIGSTVIKGISAKPIIDIAVEVENFDILNTFNDKLKEKGFIYRPKENQPEKHLYVKGGKDFRTHHVHFYLKNSAQLKNDLFFRDYLNSHPETAKKYNELKISLAEKFSNDREKYTKGKEEFIKKTLNLCVRSELDSGYYFSPGFYMDYWEKCILNKISKKVIFSDVKLKKYREMWIGSILAANQTKATNIKHYVGLPENEPPDVKIIRLIKDETPKGTSALKCENMSIEITRCNHDFEETVLEQVKKKNKPAYTNNILLVYAYGEEMINFGQLFDELQQIEIYPSEVLVAGLVQAIENGILLPPKTYTITKVYPQKAQFLVNRDDSQAFFREPEVLSKKGRGISAELVNLGAFELLIPNLDKNAQNN